MGTHYSAWQFENGNTLMASAHGLALGPFLFRADHLELEGHAPAAARPRARFTADRCRVYAVARFVRRAIDFRRTERWFLDLGGAVSGGPCDALGPQPILLPL